MKFPSKLQRFPFTQKFWGKRLPNSTFFSMDDHDQNRLTFFLLCKPIPISSPSSVANSSNLPWVPASLLPICVNNTIWQTIGLNMISYQGFHQLNLIAGKVNREMALNQRYKTNGKVEMKKIIVITCFCMWNYSNMLTFNQCYYLSAGL